MREISRPLIAALLALLLVAGLTGCGSDEPSNATPVSPNAAVVPEDHAAVQLAQLDSVDQVSEAAQNDGIDFVCGTFLSALGPTSACMVSDEGVVAVIAFDSGADLTYVVSGPAADSEVTVPVVVTNVYGVEAALGALKLSIKADNTVIGTVTFSG